MKNISKLVVCFIVSIFLSIIPVYANSIDEYFNAKDNINETKELNHSYFTLGQNVTSQGKIDGTHFVLGDNVSVNNETEYSFILGNTVNINNNVEKDIFILGNNITISKDSVIGRDLFIIGNNITIDNSVNGNIFVLGQNITINASINGNVTVDASNLNLTEKTSITGTLKYNESVQLDNKSSLISKIETYQQEMSKTTFTDNLLSMLYSAIGMIILACAINIILPKLFKSLKKEKISKDLFNICWNGLIIIFVVPFLSLLIMITGFGLSLGVITLLIYGLAIYLSNIVSSVFIGQKICSKLSRQNSYLEIAVGILVTKIVSIIPVVGVIYTLLITLLGTGLIYELFKKLRN